MSNTPSQPFAVLGLQVGATAEAIRSAYLAKVKEFPPDRAPDKFHEIHSAYKQLSDPLIEARALLKPMANIDLDEAIQSLSHRKARLPVLALLALGNDRPGDSTDQASGRDSQQKITQTNHG